MPLAYQDLDEIDNYIRFQLSGPQAANNLMSKIENSIDKFQDFAYLGSEIYDAYLSQKGYRKLVVDNYIIFYLVDEKGSRIYIMRVLYGAREYRDLL